MLYADAHGRVRIRECCGLEHHRQVVTFSLPGTADAICCFTDRHTGQTFPVQSAADNSVHVLLALGANQELELSPTTDRPVFSPVHLNTDKQTAVLSNDKLALRLAYGSWRAPTPAGVDSTTQPGPIVGVRIANGNWRGRTLLDTRQHLLSWTGTLIEEGLIRCVYEYRAHLVDGSSYRMRITLDAEQVFARIDEEFSAHETDQIVWDFSSDDLPKEAMLLDPSAGYTPQFLQYHFDQRVKRMYGWTQYSQMPENCDGYCLPLPGDETVGFFAMDGGRWRGGRLNHLELWTRRWRAGDPLTRRLAPPESKADSMPSPDRIPARGKPQCEAHCNLEGWIGKGCRSFGLMACPTADIWAPEGPPKRNAAPMADRLGHFDEKPDHEQYSRQQCLLRRLQVQCGCLPLQQQLGLTFEWPLEEAGRWQPNEFDPLAHCEFDDDSHKLQKIEEYLQARVFGYWHGAGASYSNCVAGRRIAPYMFYAEELRSRGVVDTETVQRWRSWFAFLAYLYHSDTYYPGEISMLSPECVNSMEPTIEGMANQNFYTDIINVHGTAGHVFANHPAAREWLTKFDVMWQKQLDYHRYPESGVWEESHTYFQHVLSTVLPLHRVRQLAGQHDAFAAEAFQQLIEGAIHQATPTNDFYENRRHVIAIGDHFANPKLYHRLYRVCAQGVAPHRPQLAAELYWFYREMGGTRDIGIEPAEPDLHDEHLQGLGVFFRGKDKEAGETLLALRTGNAWGHHHEDDGSIQLFAFGTQLIGDSAWGHLQAGNTKHSAAGHSRWQPKDWKPLHHRFRFNRGWVQSFGDSPWTYATTYSPLHMHRAAHGVHVTIPEPIHHWRSVVRLQPTLFLVVDTCHNDIPQETRFHVRPGDLDLTESGATIWYDRCQLSITPLWTTEAVCQRRIESTQPAGAIVTTELLFDVGSTRHQAWLVHVAPAGNMQSAVDRAGDRTAAIELGNESWKIGLKAEVIEIAAADAALCLNHRLGG